jgi:hypothetical protein
VTKNKINKAIKYLGLEIVGKRGDGYFYFCDLKHGHQVGESVLVCYLNQLTLEEWIKEAEQAKIKYINSL